MVLVVGGGEGGSGAINQYATAFVKHILNT
jgi:hypothetical protein